MFLVVPVQQGKVAAVFVKGAAALHSGDLEEAERHMKGASELLKTFCRIPSTGAYLRHKLKVRAATVSVGGRQWRGRGAFAGPVSAWVSMWELTPPHLLAVWHAGPSARAVFAAPVHR